MLLYPNNRNWITSIVKAVNFCIVIYVLDSLILGPEYQEGLISADYHQMNE